MIFAVGGLLALLAGCQLANQLLGTKVVLDLSITQTTNKKTTTYISGGASYDFGPVVPKSTTGTTVSFTAKNNGSNTVTLTGISSDDPTDYSFKTSATRVEPGASVTLSGTFTPQTRGTKPATVTIAGKIGNGAASIDFPVTGDGNYPPVADFQVAVTGVNPGYDAYKGVYVWDQSKLAYLDGNGHYIYLVRASPVTNGPQIGDWVIGPDMDPTLGDFVAYTYPNWTTYYEWATMPSTGITGVPWVGGLYNGSTYGNPGVIALDDSRGGAYSPANGYAGQEPVAGDHTLAVVFNQTDVDGDVAAPPKYEWQWSTSYTGPYQDVPSGATNATYPIPLASSSGTADALALYSNGAVYYRVIITPVAATGIAEGTPVASPPVQAFTG